MKIKAHTHVVIVVVVVVVVWKTACIRERKGKWRKPQGVFITLLTSVNCVEPWELFLSFVLLLF